MGKIVKAATSGPRALFSQGGLGAIADPKNNGIAKALGLGGDQGEYYQGTNAPTLIDPNNSDIAKQMQSRDAVNGDNGVAQALADYGSGKTSLSQALASAGAGKTGAGQLGQIQENMATNPLTGAKLATDQVNNSDILGRVYGSGKDSALSGALADEQNLQNRGYSLQPEDYEAYGQMSDQLARSFGNSEKDLAHAMAARGLNASSALQGKQFSGLEGNKLEQLASAQRQVANDRMDKNLARLNSARDYASNLSKQAGDTINNQEKQNLAGVQTQQDDRNSRMNQEMERANQLNAAMNGQFAQQSKNDQLSMESKTGAKGLTLADAMGNGAYQGVQGGTSSLVGGAMGGSAGGMPGAAGGASGANRQGRMVYTARG